MSVVGALIDTHHVVTGHRQFCDPAPSRDCGRNQLLGDGVAWKGDNQIAMTVIMENPLVDRENGEPGRADYGGCPLGAADPLGVEKRYRIPRELFGNGQHCFGLVPP